MTAHSGSEFKGKAHVVPFVVFIVLTFLPSQIPKTVWPAAPYILYAFKTLLVAWLLWHFRKSYTELSFRFHWSAPLAGILVIVAWVGLDPYYPVMGERTGFDPNEIGSESLRIATIAFRLAGAVLVVPVMEELFFRSWLARWLINPDFSAVPLGTFSWLSLIVTTGIFGFGHHEWLPGILCGLVFHGYVLWKKRLGDAIVAHAVANLALGAYVLKTGDWKFW